jgi:hypothetical protein
LQPAAAGLRSELFKLEPLVEAHAAKIFLSMEGASAYNSTLASNREYASLLANVAMKLQRMLESFGVNEKEAKRIVDVDAGISANRRAGIATSDAVSGRVVGSPTFSRYIAEIRFWTMSGP